MENKPTSSLIVALGKAFNGMTLPLSDYCTNIYNTNVRQLDQTEKVTSISPGRDILINK